MKITNETGSNKKVTLDYIEYERLIAEVDSLKSYIHQCEVEGKFKVVTIKEYLTTNYIGPDFYSDKFSFDSSVESLMDISELESAKLSSTELIVKDVVETIKELDEANELSRKLREIVACLTESKESLDKVRTMGFIRRIVFVFTGGLK